MSLFTQFVIFLTFATQFLYAAAAPSHAVRSINIPYAESTDSIDLEFHIGNARSDLLQSQQLRSRMVDASPGNTLPLFPLAQSYVAPVKIGSQSFLLLVDTGSGDTWVADSFFRCSYYYPQSYCEVGKTFELESCDSSGALISGYHFEGTYANGAHVSGPMMETQLSLTSNLKFTQEVGLATGIDYLKGFNNITSGILGLGSSYLTGKYPGTDTSGTEDVRCPLNGSTEVYDYHGQAHICNQVRYSSVGVNLNSSFTLALARASKDGYFGGTITFGGVPKSTNPRVNVTGQYVTVPIEALSFTDSDTLAFYAISVDGIQLPLTFNATAAAVSRSPYAVQAAAKRDVLRRSNSGTHFPLKRSASSTQFQAMANSTDGKAQFILDSGSATNYVPAPIARAVNSLFQPPAFKGSYSQTQVNCALDYVPSVSFSIGGVNFPINPEDMVVRDTHRVYNYDTDSYEDKDVCYSAMQEAYRVDRESGASLYILGQPFMKSSMVTIDPTNQQVGLVSRPYYSSDLP